MVWSVVLRAALCFSPCNSFAPSSGLSTTTLRRPYYKTHMFATKRGLSKEIKVASKVKHSSSKVDVSNISPEVSENILSSRAISSESQSIAASNAFDVEDTVEAAVALQLLLMGEQLETDECALAAKLVRMSLHLNHDPVSDHETQDGRNSRADGSALDSASPAFEKLMARLRQSLELGDKPWLWPESSKSVDEEDINNQVEGAGEATEGCPAETLAAFITELESSVAPVASSELAAMRSHEKTEEEADVGATSTSALGKSSAAPTWDIADYGAIAADWSMLHLWRNGAWVEDANTTLFPATCAALRHCLGSHGFYLNPMLNVGCGIARQPAGTGISRHCDGNLLGVTVHLGLDVPPPNADGERAWIEVGGERQHWANGKAIVMDTTFAHQTHNPCHQDRYVLMFQLLRPGVLPHQVGPMQRYLGQEQESAHSLHVPSARRGHAFPESAGGDLRELQPFLISAPAVDEQASAKSGDKETSLLGAPRMTTIPAYPGRMLQKSAEDPSPAIFKALKPCQWRSAPSWIAPPVQASVGGEEEVLEAGAEVLPVAFTLDEDGGVGWIACCAAAATAPFAQHVAALVSGSALHNDLASNRRLLDTSPALLSAHADLIAHPEAHLRWCPVLDESGHGELLVME